MVSHRAADTSRQAWWTRAPKGRTRARQRDHVCAQHRLPVAVYPEGFTAEEHAARLSGPLELRWHADENPPYPLYVMPRAGRTRGQPHRLRDRQPKRQERGKRGACIDPNGYDAGKKIKGKKRHILVDTIGLLLHAVVHPADIQDPVGDSEAASLRDSRDGGALVISTLFGMYLFLHKLFADGGYQGPQFASAVAT